MSSLDTTYQYFVSLLVIARRWKLASAKWNHDDRASLLKVGSWTATLFEARSSDATLVPTSDLEAISKTRGNWTKSDGPWDSSDEGVKAGAWRCRLRPRVLRRSPVVGPCAPQEIYSRRKVCYNCTNAKENIKSETILILQIRSLFVSSSSHLHGLPYEWQHHLLTSQCFTP